ncbi:energy-coupling factor ABC transporter ATP-binding protein [Promicromonospora citrea]|uniref:Cobalt ABC transporter ATP-binding protein n=1 Tax=Promicromonospora citrea TaxID=43677 RepID=A0A8H9GEH0_9MICO|nr:ABC transporter ATP-binding protein [Promicromonospora citrea]NNH52200.1 ABC transporter ATP-binding protein [Promicromonospora citrea]GGM14187.1 cobalt ABC transporter ATP-binding protein [Promicromonospora citrea]
MSYLELDSVNVRLGDGDVLRDVTCSLDERTIAVVGENGSGKSTLARLAGGLIHAASGTVRVLGLDPARDAARLRRRVALVFSNPDTQIVMPTVAEDVAFSLRADKLPRDQKARRVAEALREFGLTDVADRASHDLSGGQKQLLALCGAFVRRPDLVIADEPTAYLDARNARRVADHLFADGRHRLLLVTHDLALAQRCETAVLVQDGTIAAAGAPAAIVARYEAALGC